VFTVQGLETYILRPRDPADFDLLVETLGSPDPISWISCVIGVRGSIAPPELCNGLMVPIIAFDQIYSFDSGTLIKAIPKPEKIPAKEFGHAAQELFWRIMQMTDNAGATDEYRALNYLAVRYPTIYATVADCYGRDCSLKGVEVRPSPLSGTRNIVEAIFSFANRNTDVTEKFLCASTSRRSSRFSSPKCRRTTTVEPVDQRTWKEFRHHGHTRIFSGRFTLPCRRTLSLGGESSSLRNWRLPSGSLLQPM